VPEKKIVGTYKMARKKLNMDTLKNLKTETIIYVSLLLLAALLALGGGASIGGGAGAGVAVLGFLGFGAGAYVLATNPKNQKTCNASFFNLTENVLNPAGSDADTELDITECLAQKNAQYGGYAGVWLSSNTSTTSGNIDAYYISGDEETTVTLQPTGPSDPKKGRAFIKKGTKDDKGPKVVMKSPMPRSP
jgi:hypothetical protein